jgi:hypothetical protein
MVCNKSHVAFPEATPLRNVSMVEIQAIFELPEQAPDWTP